MPNIFQDVVSETLRNVTVFLGQPKNKSDMTDPWDDCMFYLFTIKVNHSCREICNRPMDPMWDVDSHVFPGCYLTSTATSLIWEPRYPKENERTYLLKMDGTGRRIHFVNISLIHFFWVSKIS